MNNDLISREALKEAITLNRNIERNAVCDVLDIIDNAQTVEQRPQGEWVRKVDVIQSIAKQYSEHDELVPMWLSIGNIKGSANMRDDNMNNTCKGCIHNMGNLPGIDDIYCEYIEEHINNIRCEYYEEDNNHG